MPKMIQLDSFCFQCKLKTGSKVAAYTMIVISVIAVGTMIFGAYIISSNMDEKEMATASGNKVPMSKGAAALYIIVLIVTMILAIANIGMSVLLLMAISKEKLSWLKFWVYWQAGCLAAYLLTIIATIVYIIVYREFSGLIPKIIFGCIWGYFILVVYSYYRECRRDRRRRSSATRD